MGNILGVPISYALRRTFNNESGFAVGLKEVSAYSHVVLHSSRVHKRLDLYKLFTSEKWEETGVSIPIQEEKLEHRRPISRLNFQESDEIFFCGFNSRDEKLVAKISVNCEGLASTWLYLKLSEGKSYSLPRQEKLGRVPKTGPESFVAAGLRLVCLLPMRKWRIAYSGLMEEFDESMRSKKFVFMKFSFTWTASSDIFDSQSDIPSSELASFMSTQKWDSYSSGFQRLQDQLDHYIQAGNISGTVRVEDGDEEEMYLWGSRKRTHEIVLNQDPKMEYFGYTTEGEMIYFGKNGVTGNNEKWLQYGYIVKTNSIGGPIDLCRIKTDFDQKTHVDFTTEETPWYACFEKPTFSFLQKDFQGETELLFCHLTLNGNLGNGLILSSVEYSGLYSDEWEKPRILLPVLEPSVPLSVPLVLPLSHASSKFSEISGGKGSSLSELHFISGIDKSFSVPKGVAVTIKAYEFFIQESKLERLLEILQIVAGSYQPQDFRKVCERTCATVSLKPLPEVVKNALKSELESTFGPNYQKTKVAVRSSASGEDSDEMSAAGQMTTYLGVKGIEEIYEAVVKCWASQFAYIAAQYKRQNGQLLNSPMAVVVQEMVDAEVSGVMFTCDPVSGNPARITITANYGIGESVVSASAEPDTIILERNLQEVLELKSVQVGRKNTKTVMKSTGGVTNETVDEDFASKCSLSEDFSIQLAKLGITVEEAYGCRIDIEWAIKGSNVYLLQARPVTTCDRDTDFEIMHEPDTFIRSENEWHTVANLGEVFPGATSNLGLTSINKFYFEAMLLRIYGRKINIPGMFPISPYFPRAMEIFANHSLFNVIDTMLRYYHGETSIPVKAQMTGTFGRVLDNQELFKKAERRNKMYKTFKIPLLKICFALKDLFMVGSHLKERREKYGNVEIVLNHLSTAEQVYHHIINQWFFFLKPLAVHFECTVMSSMANSVLFTILVTETGGDFSVEVYNDVAYVLSNCPKVVSADVPLDTKLLAQAIVKDYGQGFKLMDEREALMWLERSDSSSGIQFRDFLKKHGHRCVKELDIYSNPWGNDPIPLVKILQDMVLKVNNECTTKKLVNTQETIQNLKVPLSWKNRQLMKWLIPFCRKSVGQRESSKSLIISLINTLRKAYRELGDRMVMEGRLPDARLIYFLDHYELMQLFANRSPKLVQKAIRRKTLFPEMDKLVFPEMMEGIPKPINFGAKSAPIEGSLLIKGVPVSRGVAEGKARVATSLKEAEDIQYGEILIAFGTDIGWSPYFPMLKGVVTELGGIVSHGAVIAREYGLPCVVSAVGATEHFKTGDLVQIDGNKGTVQRIDE